MDAFEIGEVLTRRQEAQRLYLEFLKVPALSCGVYVLQAGATDPQQPHTEDEVYYVVSGEASIEVGEEERPVRPGSIVYVPASVEHRFHTIVNELTVLVFFAPAEYSLAGDPKDRE